MKNRGSWRGALVAAFAIGAGWIGYTGGRRLRIDHASGRAIQFTKRAIQFTKSPAGACGTGSRSQSSRKRQPCAHVPPRERISRQARPQTRRIGRRGHPLGAILVLRARTAKALAGFFIITLTITPARECDFQVVDFVKTSVQRCNRRRRAKFILNIWIDFSGHREHADAGMENNRRGRNQKHLGD